MRDTSIAKRSDDQSLQAREETRAGERYITPAVDIIETNEGLMLIADIPGATKETMNVTVEQGIMTINAPTFYRPQGQPIYAEFELAHYYRQFSIPETLNHAKARAELKNGLMTLRVPVAEAAKPRKIEIKAA